MIQAVIFDLDNTLLDFMNMKTRSVESAIEGMIEAGLLIEKCIAKDKIFKIYEKKAGNIRKYLMISFKMNWASLIIRY